MDIEKIKELLKLLEESEIDELSLEIEDESGEIKLRKGRPEGATTIYNNIAPSPMGAPVPQGGQQPSTAQAVTSQADEEADEFAGMVEITSPIVGTFYRAPAPDADPYVKVGEQIEEGQVVCIVEAMKLMNEIQSEVSGRVAKILVENAQPVEFGQVMFIIHPD